MRIGTNQHITSGTHDEKERQVARAPHTWKAEMGDESDDISKDLADVPFVKRTNAMQTPRVGPPLCMEDTPEQKRK